MVDKNYLVQIIEQHLSGTEKFLVDIKLSPGKLAVFIDKHAGITIQECSELNRFLIKELEPTGFLTSHEIEVSSPGMDQPLKIFKQYLRRIGRNVKVTTADGKLHKGKLLSANDNEFELLEIIETKQNRKKIKSDGERNRTIKLNYTEIKETKLEF